MKAEDKTAIPRVRIAVIGHADVGKSGKFQYNINNITQYNACGGVLRPLYP